MITGFLAVVLFLPIVPNAAVAQTDQSRSLDPCSASVPDAGFSDVDSLNVHKRAIDCLSWHGITANQGTFSPEQNVSRWQMALFLIRTLEVPNLVPPTDEVDEVFTDIAGLPSAQQLAINQLRELSISSGTSATTFSPHVEVSRWQMALFLSRLVEAGLVALPDGSNQGFTDIGHLTVPTQRAINQMKQLGITAGTSQTTFSPDQIVTREQMASFLTRVLKVIARLDILDGFKLICPDPGIQCVVQDFVYGQNQPFRITHGWAALHPLDADGELLMSSPNTKVEMTLDGVNVPMTEVLVALEGVTYRQWQATFTDGLTGQHRFVVSWYDQNGFAFAVTAYMGFVD